MFISSPRKTGNFRSTSRYGPGPHPEGKPAPASVRATPGPPKKKKQAPVRAMDAPHTCQSTESTGRSCQCHDVGEAATRRSRAASLSLWSLFAAAELCTYPNFPMNCLNHAAHWI